jgi:hypothetical protein
MRRRRSTRDEVVDPSEAPVPRHAAERQPEPDPVLALQRSAGNAAVARLLESRAPAAAETETRTSTIAVTAEIRRSVEPRPSGERGACAGADHDAEGDHGEAVVDAGAVTAALTSQAAPVSEPQDGARVALPDLVTPRDLAVPDTDSVVGAITYSPTVTQSGVVNPFGATTWANFNVTGATVTPGAGSFAAAFTLENPITYNVSSPKTSIADENDAALTNANFAAAADDLTPDMARQNGKPPRRRFWARDLTLRHERFHSDERSRLNRAGAAQAQTWLSAQAAGSVADVQALIAQVPGRVITASQAAVGTLDEKESRAYGDGAPSYQARADAIRTKGALGSGSGGYP